MKKILIVLATLVASAAPLLAQCPGGGPNCGGRGGPGGGGFGADLNLTAEQRTELQKLRQSRDLMQGERDKLQDARNELLILIKQEDSTDAEISKKLAEVNALQTALNTQRVSRLLQLKKILKPDQLRTLLSNMQSRGKGMGGPMGMRGGQMGGPNGRGAGPGPGAGMGQGGRQGLQRPGPGNGGPGSGPGGFGRMNQGAPQNLDTGDDELPGDEMDAGYPEL